MKKTILTLSLIALTGCGLNDDSDEMRLYRTGVGLPDMKIHVATFDAKEEAEYNRNNCEIAKEHFQQPSVTVRYWCAWGSK